MKNTREGNLNFHIMSHVVLEKRVCLAAASMELFHCMMCAYLVYLLTLDSVTRRGHKLLCKKFCVGLMWKKLSLKLFYNGNINENIFSLPTLIWCPIHTQLSAYIDIFVYILYIDDLLFLLFISMCDNLNVLEICIHSVAVIFKFPHCRMNKRTLIPSYFILCKSFQCFSQ